MAIAIAGTTGAAQNAPAPATPAQSAPAPTPGPQGPGGQPPRPGRNSFEGCPPGGQPGRFQAFDPAGAGRSAAWAVAAAPDAPDGKQVLAVQARNEGDAYNLYIAEHEHPADLAVAIWVRAMTGVEDQGGGLVWRARDAENHYLARWNPLEANVRFYKIERGKRVMLASADVQASAAAWHRLAVTMRGDEVAVRLDGDECIRHRDATFTQPGKVGLWTKADASTQFDLLEVTPAPALLTAVPVVARPRVDGAGDDPAWQGAPVTTVQAKRAMPPKNDDKTTAEAAETEVQLRCVHTADEVFVLVRWRDATKDDAAHKPWAWNTTKAAYEEGAEREDMLALAFAHTGEFDPNMLSGKEAVWDAWHWKATRTNPQGFAMDRTHVYTRAQPAGKAKQHRASNGASIWIARAEDAGATVETKQPAPAARTSDHVPQYLPGTPTGSAADVRAKGAWQDGWWTLELARRLDTGHPDDTTFVRGKRVRMGVSTHDRTGEMDKATGAIELFFDAGKQ